MRTLILPETHQKFPGALWYDKKMPSKKRYRAMYPLVEPNPVSKKARLYESYETPDEAFAFIKQMSEDEGHSRVKNAIYMTEEGHYECELSNGNRFLFDKVDLDLVQTYTWRPHTNGQVMTNKVDEIPSGMLHICIMGKPEPGHEIFQINGTKLDFRRSNMKFLRAHGRHTNFKTVDEDQLEHKSPLF